MPSVEKTSSELFRSIFIPSMFTGFSYLYGSIDNQAGDADVFLIALLLNLLFRAKEFVSF